MIWGSVQSLFNVSVLQTLSVTVCHMQARWVSFRIAGGALLEVLAGGVWVVDLPFPFSGAIVLPACQGRWAAVPAVMLVLLLTPCGFGGWFSRFSGCMQRSLSPHWRQADGRFLWIGTMKVETLLCVQLRACWWWPESYRKDLCAAYSWNTFPRLWVKGQIFTVCENVVLNTVPSAKTTEIVRV